MVGTHVQYVCSALVNGALLNADRPPLVLGMLTGRIRGPALRQSAVEGSWGHCHCIQCCTGMGAHQQLPALDLDHISHWSSGHSDLLMLHAQGEAVAGPLQILP